MAGLVGASEVSGPRTKACAALTGWRTPAMTAGANRSRWAAAFWLL